MSRFSTWCRNKGNLLCFDYAARAYLFSPDKFLAAEIIEEAAEPLRAYIPFHPAVKSMSTPDVWICKVKVFFWIVAHSVLVFFMDDDKKHAFFHFIWERKKIIVILQ